MKREYPMTAQGVRNLDAGRNGKRIERPEFFAARKCQHQYELRRDVFGDVFAVCRCGHSKVESAGRGFR